MVLFPRLANEFIWGEPAQCLEPAGEIVSRDEIGEVLAQLVMRFGIEALDRRLLDRPVHAFDLAIRPRMSGFCQAMPDIEIGTGRFESMATEQDAIGPHGLDILRCPSVAGRIGAMRAIVCQHGMDAVWNRSGEGAQKVTGNATCCFPVQLDECEFRCPINRHNKDRGVPFQCGLRRCHYENSRSDRS